VTRWRYAAALAALLMTAGTTACGGSEDKVQANPATPAGSATTSSTGSTDQPPGTATASVMPDLKAAQVVAALKAAGRSCSNELTYVICKQGTVEVWVLTGDHRRPPVLSLNAAGSADEARTAIGDQLTEVLTAAHVNGVAQIAEWYAKQTAETASTEVGDWKVELSTEQDSDVPGVHLTLNDKLCKANCEGE
jgi:hypothetical protein